MNFLTNTAPQSKPPPRRAGTATRQQAATQVKPESNMTATSRPPAKTQAVSSASPKNTPAKKDSLGRLKQLGLKETWQTALLLPKGWDDLRLVISDFHPASPYQEGQYVLVHGKLSGTPKVSFQGTPRLTGYLVDPAGHRLGFSQFGDTKKLQASLKPEPNSVYLYGQVRHFNNSLWLQNIERIPPSWVGRLRPQYPGKTRVITPETVRQRVFSHLKASVAHTAHWLAHELSSFGSPEALAELANNEGWSLSDLLTKAHLPANPETGRKAQEGVEILAGLGIIQKAMASQRETIDKPLSVGVWEERAEDLPFSLTEEQRSVIAEIVDDLAAPATMHNLLVGDVGTGKTAVYAHACAACLDGGGRVAILLPSMPLAAQVAKDFQAWWPDLKLQLVTGETDSLDPDCPLIIGTTAILFRMTEEPDLLVVDEQQKFSREQREQLVGKGTNLLEVSATCIPRSQALVRYGVVKMLKLTKCHVKKKIHTRIWTQDCRAGLFENVKHTVDQGKQVLVIYPRREAGKKEGQGEDKHTVEEAFKSWSKLFPGRVRFSHGGLSDEAKQLALQDMLDDKADILIATTVVEVGINLPKLYRGVIVHPDRLGLSTLHQLRGRIARAGGCGWCDLYMPTPIKPDTMKRLEILTKTEDGFKIAEQDMRLRGIGDLGQTSDKQTGADDTFLFGRPVKMETLDLILSRFRSATGPMNTSIPRKKG